MSLVEHIREIKIVCIASELLGGRTHVEAFSALEILTRQQSAEYFILGKPGKGKKYEKQAEHFNKLAEKYYNKITEKYNKYKKLAEKYNDKLMERNN
jgi:hypothetical protein